LPPSSAQKTKPREKEGAEMGKGGKSTIWQETPLDVIFRGVW